MRGKFLKSPCRRCGADFDDTRCSTLCAECWELAKGKDKKKYWDGYKKEVKNDEDK